MNLLLTRKFRISAAVLLLSVNVVHAYIVGPPVSMGKLTEEADIIFKGTVVSSSPAPKDDWFKPVHGFMVAETQFKVISVIKGEVAPGATLRFRHYVLKGMTARAKTFRKRANEKATYDLEYYFKQVDKNPSHNSL